MAPDELNGNLLPLSLTDYCDFDLVLGRSWLEPLSNIEIPAPNNAFKEIEKIQIDQNRSE